MGGGTVTRDLVVQCRKVSPDLLAALPGTMDPVVRRVYAARGVGPGDLGPGLARMLPVGALGGVAAAADWLADARDRQAAILVVGDFDADGATSTAIMVSALRAMGFSRVSYLVPNRFEYGYGLSPAVADLAARNRPEIVVTVDNGISSVEGVQRARELGMDVLVTDHHLPGPELPAARVIVNPNLEGEAFASKALCGAGVAFYVMAGLAHELARRSAGQPRALQRAVADCLDLVAFGTVADMVPLDPNNRVLVGEGLRRIRAGRTRPGLEALFDVAQRDMASARAADLAFGLAPRLNAAGRLTDMSVGVECLLAPDRQRALDRAHQLDELNRARRDLQQRMVAEAVLHLDRLTNGLAAGTGQALCMFDPGWHEGIVGLVASRIKELAGCPAVAFAPSDEPGFLKGSARSVEGIHIRDVLASVALNSGIQGMKFGGHAMAAGLRIPASALDEFDAAFSAAVGRQAGAMDTRRVVWTDGPLEASQISLALAEELYRAGPWGQGFPEPFFDNEFIVLDQRVLKDRHLKLSLRHPAGGNPVDAIAFNQIRPLSTRARCIYRLDINDFGGRRRQQLVVEHFQCE